MTPQIVPQEHREPSPFYGFLTPLGLKICLNLGMMWQFGSYDIKVFSFSFDPCISIKVGYKIFNHIQHSLFRPFVSKISAHLHGSCALRLEIHETSSPCCFWVPEGRTLLLSRLPWHYSLCLGCALASTTFILWSLWTICLSPALATSPPPTPISYSRISYHFATGVRKHQLDKW